MAFNQIRINAMRRHLEHDAIIKLVVHLGLPVGPGIVGAPCRPRATRTVDSATAIYAEAGIKRRLKDCAVLAVPRGLEGCLGQGHYPPEARLDDSSLQIRYNRRPSSHSHKRKLAFKGRAIREHMHALADRDAPSTAQLKRCI